MFVGTNATKASSTYRALIQSLRVYALPRQSPELFRQARVGEHGTEVVWTDEINMAADKLWRLAQEQAGETMTPDAFRHWRERKALKTLSILYQSYRSTSLGQGNSGALNLYYSRHDDM